MKTYTPKPGELEEMGFTYEIGNDNWWEYKCGLYDFLYFPKNDISERWWFGYRRMFPRNRKHLEQIILAFTKPE